MAFDLDKLYAFSVAEIEKFAATHQDEAFYAFAIDASLLCLNSEEQLQRTIERYQEKWDRQTRHIDRWEDLTDRELDETRWLIDMKAKFAGLDPTDTQACLAVINDEREQRRKKGDRYRTERGVQSLRENTGNWAYQGFAEMTDAVGFDQRAYQEHYDLPEDKQKTSEYGSAMDALVERLRTGTAFECLRKSPSFRVARVEHN